MTHGELHQHSVNEAYPMTDGVASRQNFQWRLSRPPDTVKRLAVTQAGRGQTEKSSTADMAGHGGMYELAGIQPRWRPQASLQLSTASSEIPAAYWRRATCVDGAEQQDEQVIRPEQTRPSPLDAAVACMLREYTFW